MTSRATSLSIDAGAGGGAIGRLIGARGNIIGGSAMLVAGAKGAALVQFFWPVSFERLS